jgi:hypothetical protein
MFFTRLLTLSTHKIVRGKSLMPFVDHDVLPFKNVYNKEKKMCLLGSNHGKVFFCLSCHCCGHSMT